MVESQVIDNHALDALVAERVMGWKWVTAPWVWDDPRSPIFGPDAHYLLPPGGVEATRGLLRNWPTSGSFTYEETEREKQSGRHLTWHRMPSYSAQMNDAWMVVTELRTRGWYCALLDITPPAYPVSPGAIWCCTFGHYPQLRDVEEESSTPAQAICLAALRVVDVQ